MRLPTILIVDSERKLRRALHATLVTQGYAAIESRTGEKALRIIQTTRPDLVLLDLNLPGVHGIDICRQIRRSCDVPIIVVTARSGQHDKVLALDAGADDYIVKPFEWEELLARIRAFLRRVLPAECHRSLAKTLLLISSADKLQFAVARCIWAPRNSISSNISLPTRAGQ